MQVGYALEAVFIESSNCSTRWKFFIFSFVIAPPPTLLLKFLGSALLLNLKVYAALLKRLPAQVPRLFHPFYPRSA